MMVFVSAAGTSVMGITMKQKGVSPESIRSMGMLIDERRAMRSQMKPTGNRNPKAMKNTRRQR